MTNKVSAVYNGLTELPIDSAVQTASAETKLSKIPCIYKILLHKTKCRISNLEQLTVVSSFRKALAPTGPRRTHC